MNRFIRTRQLLGSGNMELLMRATVAVFGLGGVGSYAVEALARSGVGCLRLVDHDTIQHSNINRQLFALESTVGMAKVDVAARRIRDINPGCVVETHRVFADEETVPGLLDPAPSILIDAIDALGPKVGLISYAVEKDIPIVACMGAAARTDAECVRSADISESYNCPLARMIRKRLHRRGIFRGVRCVFSPEDARSGPPVPCTDDDSVFFERGRRRQPLGSISYLPAIFGFKAAGEAIGFILRTGTSSIKT